MTGPARQANWLSKMALLALLAAAIAAVPATAHADEVVIYNISGATLQQGTLSGTFTMDLTTRHVTSASFTADGLTGFVCTPTNQCALYATNGGANNGFSAVIPSTSDFVSIEWPTFPLALPVPQTVSLSGTFCQGCEATGWDYLVSGTMTDAPAATPEPGTAYLILTGISGLGWMKMRLRRRSRS